MILISLLAYRQDRSILVVPGSNINNSVKEAGLIGSFAAATPLLTFLMILISLLAYRQDRSILVVPGSNIKNSDTASE